MNLFFIIGICLSFLLFDGIEPSNVSYHALQSENSGDIFATYVLNGVRSSPDLVKLFELERFSNEEIAKAFETVMRNIASYTHIDLVENIGNITREAIQKAFDPSLYLQIFVESLADFLSMHNYLVPDSVTVAKGFVENLRNAADTTDGLATVALANVEAVIKALHFFFIQDLIKSGPSELSAFTNDLLFAKSTNDFFAPVVPEVITDSKNITIFVKTAVKNITSEKLFKLFDIPFSRSEIADAFYQVVYDFGLSTFDSNFEITAQNLRSAVLVNFDVESYMIALLKALGTTSLQHKYFSLQFVPKAGTVYIYKRLKYNSKSAKEDLGPASYIRAMANVVYELLVLLLMSLESPPSIFSLFVEKLYLSKNISYVLPDLRAYEIEHHLIDPIWLQNFYLSDP